MARCAYDYSQRFQLHVIDAEGTDQHLCSRASLLEAALARGGYRYPKGRYYVLDHLAGNKCSVGKALHPDVIFQPVP